MNYPALIEKTDFQLSGKMSDTMKYFRDILKIIELHVWFYEIKLPQLVYLLKCMMATFDVYKYSFCEINTYCINKPCIFSLYFFFIPCTAKIIIICDRWSPQKQIKFKYINILDKKKRINIFLLEKSYSGQKAIKQ